MVDDITDWIGKTLAKCTTAARDRKKCRELVFRGRRPSAIKACADHLMRPHHYKVFVQQCLLSGFAIYVLMDIISDVLNKKLFVRR